MAEDQSPATEPQAETTPAPTEKKQKPWPVIGLTTLLILSLGATGYLTYQNNQLKKELQVISFEPQPDETKPTPTQTKLTKEIKIIDGNVCLVTLPDEVKILVNKNDHQSEAISGFGEVITSPDGTKICFLGYSPVPIWLYIANTDGSNVVKVGLGKNCAWSHDSQKIAFNNHTTDVSPVDIYVYDALLEKTDNITESLQANVIRLYGIPTWSEDDSEVSGEFTTTDMSGQTQRNGASTINIITGEIEDTILSD